MPTGAELIAYAYDLPLFVGGAHEEDVQGLDCALTSISRLMLPNQLQLAS